MNHRQSLEMAEYFFVAASFVGSGVAAISGQILYVSIPLSVALLLNLMNRRHLRSEYRQGIAGVMTQVKHRVNTPLGTQQSTNEEFATLVSALKQLRSQQQNLEKSLLPMKGEIKNLTEQFQTRPELQQIESLTAVITALQQYLDSLPSPGGLPIQLADLEQQLTQAISRIPALVETEVQQQLHDREPPAPPQG